MNDCDSIVKFNLIPLYSSTPFASPSCLSPIDQSIASHGIAWHGITWD